MSWLAAGLTFFFFCLNGVVVVDDSIYCSSSESVMCLPQDGVFPLQYRLSTGN